MELTAAIRGLSALNERCCVELYSDSEYVVRAMNNGWPHKWKNRGWRRTGNKEVANQDLWEHLLELCSRHQVTFLWVKGHAGIQLNERCDQLAVAVAQEPNLPADVVYENSDGAENLE